MRVVGTYVKPMVVPTIAVGLARTATAILAAVWVEGVAPQQLKVM
jgi:hypothetical protein